MNKLYVSLKRAKNGSLTPLFRDGSSMHSQYNPEREADLFVSGFSAVNGLFFVVAGIGGGYHIRALAEKLPEAFILAVENSKDDFTTVKGIPCVHDISSNPRIRICTLEELPHLLQQLYIPQLYGTLQIVPYRSWADKNPEGMELLHKILTKDLTAISADYSVQSHFGHLWQRNIMLNLAIASEHKNVLTAIPILPVKKTAAVIAAGPSFDETFSRIAENRGKYYVIATDTAYQTLRKRGFHADAVVSIDAQTVSHNHFCGKTNRTTLFIFDLCANPASVRNVLQVGSRVLFIQSGHPLSAYAAYHSGTSGNIFPNIYAGAGTVTIAACDFAFQAGFDAITVFGADFSYIAGKPYMRGTYLENLYYAESTKLFPAELNYAKLMFRTPLIRDDAVPEQCTTEILNSYAGTFRAWANIHIKNIEIKNNVVSLTGRIRQQQNVDNEQTETDKKFDMRYFSTFIRNDITKTTKYDTKIAANKPLVATVLPYIAYLQNHNRKLNKTLTFIDYLKLAYSNIVRYTDKI